MPPAHVSASRELCNVEPHDDPSARRFTTVGPRDVGTSPDRYRGRSSPLRRSASKYGFTSSVGPRALKLGSKRSE